MLVAKFDNYWCFGVHRWVGGEFRGEESCNDFIPLYHLVGYVRF